MSGYADKQAAKAEEKSGLGKQSSKSRSSSAITAMHTIEAFILSLGHRSEDGRVLLSMSPKPQPQPESRPTVTSSKVKPKVPEKDQTSLTPQQPVVTLKYQLLNPANAFKDLTDEARAVVLAGGTMEPVSSSINQQTWTKLCLTSLCIFRPFQMSDFRTQLMPNLDSGRFATLSCGHVIPPNNLLAIVVSSGPRGTPFEFKFDSRNNLDLVSLSLVIQ